MDHLGCNETKQEMTITQCMHWSSWKELFNLHNSGGSRKFLWKSSQHKPDHARVDGMTDKTILFPSISLSIYLENVTKCRGGSGKEWGKQREGRRACLKLPREVTCLLAQVPIPSAPVSSNAILLLVKRKVPSKSLREILYPDSSGKALTVDSVGEANAHLSRHRNS